MHHSPPPRRESVKRIGLLQANSGHDRRKIILNSPKCWSADNQRTGTGQFNGDHVIPKSRGGNGDPTNLTPACQTCNLKKGPRTPAEWYEQMRLQNLKS